MQGPLQPQNRQGLVPVKSLLLSGAMLLAFSPLAFAQVSQSSQSNGHSSSEAVIENDNGGGSSGGYESRYGNNPDMAAPTLYSNDACSSAVAGAASFLGIGISAGATSEIKGCVQRQWFILMQTTALKTGQAAYGQWAINIACATPAIASQAPAGVCGSVAPVVAPLAVRTVPMAAVAYSPQPVAKPDYCGTISRGDRVPPECN